ncbi:hypothetical protein ASPBRDRAFT_47831 [Aspergillus brasiliensis CBS 101740]|uniref:Uncharacterized protein n=1 Tax=Aspergillus brasiliensis (strain CBS 101740 / IMI 381727 / IBT 21946) TaxID=767769 RepID=A0A1L9U6L8_ASPBC|nr:hypothetical protein ASPBRDRAFT_47831 [Aspergillus brasiliensis CBS 101740]
MKRQATLPSLGPTSPPGMNWEEGVAKNSPSACFADAACTRQPNHSSPCHHCAVHLAASIIKMGRMS